MTLTIKLNTTQLATKLERIPSPELIDIGATTTLSDYWPDPVLISLKKRVRTVVRALG